MKHIRFMTDNEPVCENPARLDLFDSPVIAEYGEEEGCKDCSALLFEHNKKAFESEMTYGHNRHVHEDPLAPAKGIMWGVLFSSVFWVLLVMIIWIIVNSR